MLLRDLVAAGAQVAATRSRRRKVELLAACLAAMTVDEVAVGTSYAAGEPRQPRLDVGWSSVRAIDPEPADAAGLSLLDVHAALEELAAVGGVGSRARRQQILERLLGAATADEQRYLKELMLGELRQGALRGVVAQAIAQAFDVTEVQVRRAEMLSGDLGQVAAVAASAGGEGLAAFRLQLFRPIQPMLATTAADLTGAFAGLESAVVEAKLDGARVQVHRAAEKVRVYTRNLRDITDRVPEVVAVTGGLAVDAVVLDGEVLALRDDRRPHPFQDTMSRFGTERALEEMPGELVLTPFFFDCLHLDGEDLLDRPLADRAAALARAVPSEHRVMRQAVDTSEAAEALMADVLDAGHEGVMVKALDSLYEAGRRGAAWRKVKPVHTFDLVVLAVEWGSGRRRGWLSNLHLGARDEDGGFVMLGKTFKGMTDEILEWQTKRLLELETSRDGHIVYVHPKLVVEVAVDGVQSSTRYPGGVTLRFARIKGYRHDKAPSDADTIEAVRALRR